MSLFTSLPFLLLTAVTASCADTETENCENIRKTCPVIACGPPGINGIPGKDGRDGAKGEKGEPGTVWDESWTIKKAENERIDAFELWCWRRLLRIPWTARRSNQSILKEISPEHSLEGLMLKLKLQ